MFFLEDVTFEVFMNIQVENFSRWLDMLSEVQSRGLSRKTNLGVNRWYMDEVNRYTEKQRGPE